MTQSCNALTLGGSDMNTFADALREAADLLDENWDANKIEVVRAILAIARSMLN